MNPNLILMTDSYKLGHWSQYPVDTEAVYSYFESRKGAQYDETVFFGLQAILEQYLEGQVVTMADIEEARELARHHFGMDSLFHIAGWMHIVEKHDGYLPLRIKAVPEGTPVPTGNVLMTVESTDPYCYWLTNAVESLLTHVWAPSTVATMSRHAKKVINSYLEQSSDGAGSDFMLHDFGYRGVSSHESAAIEGAGHLVNFKGTDTLPAMILARDHYDADFSSLAFSVPATEHSVMTSMGPEGEPDIVERLIRCHPTGIVSCVGDSYDIYNFVTNIMGVQFKDAIMARDGKFVVRPDSPTPEMPTPAEQVVWILKSLWKTFGGTENSKGFKVLDPHVGVLWGDGIDVSDMKDIMHAAVVNGFSAENLVFGMGGGLLQKINRDTQRFAFKASAIKRSGQWHDVYKRPRDITKASKRGRFSLIEFEGKLITVNNADSRDLLHTVFENGIVLNRSTFDDVRERAALVSAMPSMV